MIRSAQLTLFVILGMMSLASLGIAQEDTVSTATSALQSVLSNLKQSVEQLSVDNDQLTSKDNAIKQQVMQLQMQLQSLEARGDALSKTAAKLQEKNPGRAQQISRLGEENADLDVRTQKVQDAIQLIQQSLEAGFQEDQQLLLQLKGMTNAPAPLPEVQSPESQAADHRQIEKLKLMKMIYDSQQRQESLHEAILDYQKNTPLVPAAGALAHQELLKEQIRDLEGQIAAYQTEKSSGIQGDRASWDDGQLHQMEMELKVLQHNYLQLKDLMEQMSKKAQNGRVTVSQHIEGEKLQNNIDDLNRQGEGLRADLDDLRSQMVDLDKRKSRLETMIKQLP